MTNRSRKAARGSAASSASASGSVVGAGRRGPSWPRPPAPRSCPCPQCRSVVRRRVARGEAGAADIDPEQAVAIGHPGPGIGERMEPGGRAKPGTWPRTTPELDDERTVSARRSDDPEPARPEAGRRRARPRPRPCRRSSAWPPRRRRTSPRSQRRRSRSGSLAPGARRQSGTGTRADRARASGIGRQPPVRAKRITASWPRRCA